MGTCVKFIRVLRINIFIAYKLERMSDKNYYDYGADDERIRNSGLAVLTPIQHGPAGFGSGMHYVLRISKEDYKKVPSEGEWKKIKDERLKKDLEEKEKTLQKILNEAEEKIEKDIKSIKYTNDPKVDMSNLDIDDNPININKLIDSVISLPKSGKIAQLLREESSRKSQFNNNWDGNWSDEIIITMIKDKYIETERKKMYPAAMEFALKKHPAGNHKYYHPDSAWKISEGMRKEELINKIMDEHMAEKMPKIEAVLAQVRAHLIMDKETKNIFKLNSIPKSVDKSKKKKGKNKKENKYSNLLGIEEENLLTMPPEKETREKELEEIFKGGKTKRKHTKSRKTRKSKKSFFGLF